LGVGVLVLGFWVLGFVERRCAFKSARSQAPGQAEKREEAASSLMGGDGELRMEQRLCDAAIRRPPFSILKG
jgi:hypothetical protein